MNLSQYVKKRNGVPIGHSSSLWNNLQRSLGAKNFSAFWNFWNPIFGYYLGVRVFRPLKKKVPTVLALIFTFVFCGMVHDFVTTVIRGKLSLFFSVWFFLMGIAVAVAKYIDYDFSKQRWIFRALTNILIVGFCLLLTILLNRALEFY